MYIYDFEVYANLNSAGTIKSYISLIYHYIKKYDMS